MFNDNTSFRETLDSVTEQLSLFDAKTKDFDDFVNSLQCTEAEAQWSPSDWLDGEFKTYTLLPQTGVHVYCAELTIRWNNSIRLTDVHFNVHYAEYGVTFWRYLVSN